MKQLTKEEAIRVYNSKVWKNWTADEIFHFQIRQDKLCVPFAEFQKATEKVLNRPVYTHEFGMSRNGLLDEALGGKQPSLKEIIEMLPKDKTIIALVK